MILDNQKVTWTAYYLDRYAFYRKGQDLILDAGLRRLKGEINDMLCVQRSSEIPLNIETIEAFQMVTNK